MADSHRVPASGHLPQSSGTGTGDVGGPRRLGMLGTLVWDRIHHPHLPSDPQEGWGGLSYSLEAVSSVLSKGWLACPILRLGSDLADDALDYLSSIPGTVTDPGVEVVQDPNPRVELRYRDADRRTERLQGLLPPWTWSDLEPVLADLDALYVNFITGLELELETALDLSTRLSIPLYADLHSLFLGRTGEGVGFPRALPSQEGWLRAFDALQMNEAELLRLATGPGTDPWELSEALVVGGTRIVAVTRGSRGAACVAATDGPQDPEAWPQERGPVPRGKDPIRKDRPASGEPPSRGDPTGCGDVWGATFFARLLEGDSLEPAMEIANRQAALKVEHRGARGLGRHLRLRGGSRPPPPR